MYIQFQAIRLQDYHPYVIKSGKLVWHFYQLVGYQKIIVVRGCYASHNVFNEVFLIYGRLLLTEIISTDVKNMASICNAIHINIWLMIAYPSLTSLTV